MDIAVVTGSAGLVGAETVRYLIRKGFTVVGIDNDMRKVFFGSEASTAWSRRNLLETYAEQYHHHDMDIRNYQNITKLFETYSSDIKLIIHAAAQPSHDWAAREPHTDFSINATGTLNLLEATRIHTRDAVFIFVSTNKIYGDRPNELPLVELETRWEIEKNHPYYGGIGENMSIDQTKHSLFGASKASADILVQEYGRYFGMKTVCFRGGCLTGGGHSGTELHGFLSYLMKCAMTGVEYSIFGYKGKQVRDNIHSHDLIDCFYHFYLRPRVGEVYNIGGSRKNSCSILEAIGSCEEIVGKKMKYRHVNQNRIGDHIWYISSVDKFKNHYPEWNFKYGLSDIYLDIYRGFKERLQLQE